MDFTDHYAVLGVPRRATAADIVKAYQVVRRTAAGDPGRAAVAADAYLTLSDAGKRAAYDATLQPVSAGPATEYHSEPKSVEQPVENVFSRVWRGDEKLTRILWFWVVLGNCIAIFVLIVALSMTRTYPPALTGTAWNSAWVYTLFSGIALWRGAGKQADTAGALAAIRAGAVAVILLALGLFSFGTMMEKAMQGDFRSSAPIVGSMPQVAASDEQASAPSKPESLLLTEEYAKSLAQQNVAESAGAGDVGAHFAAIRQAHPDADSLVDDRYFLAWIASQPSEKGTYYRRVLESGTAEEVIGLFSAYKAYVRQATVGQGSNPVSSQNLDCEFKPVMTDSDYRACGLTPP